MILFYNLKKVGLSLFAKSLFVLTLCAAGIGQAVAQNEAQIGTTEYPTLEEAVAAATSGDVVEIIVANCGIVNTTTIPAGITIKGLGKTATTMLIESTSGSGLTLNNANVTLKDMTIDGSQITSGGYKTLVNVRADGCLITDVVMTGGGTSTWNSSILVETLPSTATFTVRNSTISGAFRGVLRESCSANIVIDNCDITATYPFNIDGGSGGTVTVTDGALHGWTSYSHVDLVTFTNVSFSGGYNLVAAYENTVFNNCTMTSDFMIYAQVNTGFDFTFNDCTKGGVLITTENFKELFPTEPGEFVVWDVCVTTVNDVVMVGTQAQLDAAAASGPAIVSTQMTQSFAYDGNLCPNITSLTVKGGNGGDSTLTFSNCTVSGATLTENAGKYTLSYTCNGCAVTLDNVAVVLGEGASITVGGQTNFFKTIPLYKINETDNGNGTYTYSTEYVGVARIGTTPYATLNEAAAAVVVGTPTTIEILQNLNFYDITQSNIQNKTITFTGTPTDTLTLSDAAHKTTNASGANLTFENITLKNDMEPDSENRGIIHLSNLTINDCEIIGFMRGFASEQTVCNNCTFTKTGKYHMWTYGSNCTFNGCTFNSYGNGDCKAINIYKEGDLSQPYRTVTFNDCAFNSIPAVTTLDNSAIQINSQYCCFVVYINNCSVNGYINNSSSITDYPNLVNNKSTSVATTLYINGTRVLKQGSCDPVAQIGETYYTTLQDALDAAHDMTGDVTIELLTNTEGYSIVHQKAGLNITIEGGNDTIFGQIFVDGDGRASGTETLTIQNVAFKGNTGNFISTSDDAFVMVPSTKASGKPYYTGKYNYAHNVTISNCSFTSTSSSLNVVGFKATSGATCYNLKVLDVTGDNLHSLAQLTATEGALIDNCTAINTGSFVNISGGSGIDTISNCTYTGVDPSDGYGVRENGNSSVEVILINNTFEANNVLQLGKNGGSDASGHINVESGTYKGNILNDQSASGTATFVFTGGTFDQDAVEVQGYCAYGYEAVASDPTDGYCTVRKLEVAQIGTTTYPSLQDALDAAHEMSGDVTIELLKNINGYSIVHQKAGLNITIEGGNDTIFGQIIVDGNGRASGTETLTIQNIAFQDDKSNFYTGTDAFILIPSTKTAGTPYYTNAYNYAHNITVVNCSFTSTSSSLDVVGCKATSGAGAYNLVFDNTKGDNLHSFAQLTGTTGSTFTNDTVTNSKSFVNVSGGAGDHSITNCSFVTSATGGYGIREKGASSATITLADNAFTCTTPIQLGDNDRPVGTINVESGLYNSIAATPLAIIVDFCDTCATCPAKVVLTGGTYNEDATTVQNYCAPGYSAIPNDPDAEHCTVRSIYVVIYNANGGTGTMLNDTVVVSNPDVTVKPCGFTNDTYAFATWNTKADGTGTAVAPGTSMTLTKDTILYAQWGRVYNATQGTTHDDLQAAIDAASANDSLVVLTDLSTSTKYEVTKNLIINGGKHIITTTANRGLWIAANDVNLKLKNFNLVGGSATERGVQVNSNITGVTLTMDSCRVSNILYYAINICGGVNNLTLNVTNSYIQGWSALNSYAANSTMTFDNDTLYGINPYDCSGGGSNNYGVIVLDGGTLAGVAGTETTTVAITNSVIIAQANSTCQEYWTSIQYGSSITNVTVDDNTVILDGIGGDDKSDAIYMSGIHNSITMPLDDEVVDSLIANYFTVTDNGNGTYTISHSVYYYWPSGSDFAGVYTDFHAPFTEGWLAAGEYVKLIENVSMTQNVAADIDGNFFLNFQNGAETHSITQNGYSIELGQGTSATTDLQAPSGLFTSTFGDVVEIHNSNDTYTYVVALTMVLDSTDVVCYGENNGTDTVKINGGMAPFRIVLSSSVLSQNDTVNTTERLHIYTGLKAGSYAVEIKDALQTITGTFTINQPDTLVISNITLPDAPCPLMGVGEYTVSMTATGGNGGNVIVWSGDANDINDTITTVTPDADDRDRTYNVYVTVTDVKGCMATDTVSFSVSPVIANDATTHSNTTMTIDAVNKGIIYGCDTIIRDFGTPAFTFTNAAIDEHILDTIYNNVPTVAPDSIFPIGTTIITWTAVDTCGHAVTAEQEIIIYHLPCPNAVDGDGISYPSVRVGCYCWMAENLRSTHYSDGTREIPNVMQYTVPTRAIDYNGNLYDWNATMDVPSTNSVSDIEAAYAANESVQGICPEGWHVPTEAEVTNLMSSASTESLMAQGVWLPDVGTNTTGFNMLPSGEYNSELDRYERKSVGGYFWILTPPTAVYHACEFGSACSTLEMIPGSLTSGFSVRCVKDEQ